MASARAAAPVKAAARRPRSGVALTGARLLARSSASGQKGLRYLVGPHSLTDTNREDDLVPQIFLNFRRSMFLGFRF